MRDRIRRENQEKLQKVRKFKKDEIKEDGSFISESLQKKIAKKRESELKIEKEGE